MTIVYLPDDTASFDIVLPRRKLYSGNAHDRRVRRRLIQRTAKLTVTFHEDKTPSVRETFNRWGEVAKEGQAEYERQLRELEPGEYIMYPVSLDEVPSDNTGGE